MNKKEKFVNDNLIQKIKSIYTILNIFEYLHQKNKLQIVKINKELQRNLDLTIHNYKDYSEKFSSIEIIVIPTKKRIDKSIFINYEDINNKYYHIYFNNINKEVKRNYIDKIEDIFKIKIIRDSAINRLNNLFENCKEIESIYFTKFIRNNIINMRGMFSGCSKLKTIKFFQINTINVTSMDFMFCKCPLLKELDLSEFDTHNVEGMNSMFFCCSSLEKLDISNFNINKVDSMIGMFFKCSSLKELKIKNFNTQNATTQSMIDFCPVEIVNKIKHQNPKIRVFKTKEEKEKENMDENFCLIY